MNLKNIFLFCSLLTGSFSAVFAEQNSRIPFYEDYFEQGNLGDYLDEAQSFLEKNPEAPEAARVALDYLMMSKAAENIHSVKEATNLLMFDYLGSLPSLFFLSSFDAGSPRLNQLLLAKTEENDPHDANFSRQFCQTLNLLTRLHGPKSLNDPVLRIRSFLISQNSDLPEIQNLLREAVLELKENPNYKSVAEIITSDKEILGQVIELSQLSDNDSEFCMNFLSAKLKDGQLNSAQLLELQIDRALFSLEPNPRKAQDLISRLPAELAKTTKYQTYLAFAQVILGNKDSSLETLKYALTKPNGELAEEWAETATDFSNGQEFEDSRKKLLLSQLEKAVSEINKPRDALFVRFRWSGDPDTTTNSSLDGYIGFSVPRSYFEFQAYRNDQPFFAYRTDASSSALFSKLADEEINLRFTESGAIPVPTVDIQRDQEKGTFNYSFNLNFSKDYQDLLNQAGKTLENSYLSTSTGREVLVNHLISKKGMWFTPPAATETGTKFKMNTLQKSGPTPKKAILHIELSGDITEAQIGSLHIEKIHRGSEEVLTEMPKWPSETFTERDGFDFQLLLQAVSQFTQN